MQAIEAAHEAAGEPGGPDPGAVTLTQLRALTAAAEAGGFTAAARALGSSQSAVSHAVRALEVALGAGPLLSRAAGAEPTALGSEVLAEARAALAAVARLRLRAAAAAGVASGTLKIAAVGSASARLLPGPLRAFRAAHPVTCVTVFEGTDAEVAGWVREGVAELGVAVAPEAGPAAADLAAEPFTEDAMLLVVPRGHRLAARRAVCAADLTDEPFLMSSAGCEGAIGAFFAAACVAPRVAATVRDMPTLLAMAREGVGVTIVPALVLPDPALGLRTVPLDPPCARRLVVLRRADHAPLPLAAVFLRAIQSAAQPPVRLVTP